MLRKLSIVGNVDGVDTYPSLMKISEFEFIEFVLVHNPFINCIEWLTCNEESPAAVPENMRI